MSTKKYKGPVETIEHAMMAHLVVTVECTVCRHWTTMWAWRIYKQWKNKVAVVPLREPVDGFWCRECRPGGSRPRLRQDALKTGIPATDGRSPRCVGMPGNPTAKIARRRRPTVRKVAYTVKWDSTRRRFIALDDTGTLLGLSEVQGLAMGIARAAAMKGVRVARVRISVMIEDDQGNLRKQWIFAPPGKGHG